MPRFHLLILPVRGNLQKTHLSVYIITIAVNIIDILIVKRKRFFSLVICIQKIDTVSRLRKGDVLVKQ